MRLVNFMADAQMAGRYGGAEVTEKPLDEFPSLFAALPGDAPQTAKPSRRSSFGRPEEGEDALCSSWGRRPEVRATRLEPEMIRNDRDYGTQSNPKVWVMREFTNSEGERAWPASAQGRTRFYRRDDADGRLEFTGENLLDHAQE